MNDLLARLSMHPGGRAEALRAAVWLPLAELGAARRRAQQPIAVIGDRAALALADPGRLEQLLGHLVQNAGEASAPADPVTISVTAGAERVTIEEIDQGCGMSPAFLRDQLFKPIVSTKTGGIGIGAFEARQLAEAMGGNVVVTSREGECTHFRVTLASATGHVLALGEAA